MSPYEVGSYPRHTRVLHLISFQATSPSTLAAFLMENEGKRCVVVLDVSDFPSLGVFLLTLIRSRV